MKARQIRFSPEVWDVIEYEAAREGVSVAQYIRDAALTRAAYAMGERGEDPMRTTSDLARRLADLATGSS